MKEIKLIFFIKKEKTNGTGNSAIYGKIAVRNTSATFSTGYYIEPERWDKTNHLRNPLKIENEKIIREHLNITAIKADSIYFDLLNNCQENITAESIKSVLSGNTTVRKEHTKTLMEAIDYHNSYFEKLVHKGEKAEGTLKRYICIKKIVREFMNIVYGNPDIELNKIDKYFINRFDSYLRTEKTYKNNIGCCNNTTVKYIRNLGTILNYVEGLNWVALNPFSQYTKKLVPVETTYLEEEELKTIEKKEYSCDRLNTVRDIFLFSCYTAFAPIDAMKLTWANVTEFSDGKKWIIANREKTNVEVSLPILPPALRIITKFKNDPRCADQQRLLPAISNQNMNAYLKEIADICSIQKKLTWYVSRHTFATTVTLNHNIPLEIVSRMMGHTTTKQTQHYAKVLKKYIAEHMNKLAETYV